MPNSWGFFPLGHFSSAFKMTVYLSLIVFLYKKKNKKLVIITFIIQRRAQGFH